MIRILKAFLLATGVVLSGLLSAGVTPGGHRCGCPESPVGKEAVRSASSFDVSWSVAPVVTPPSAESLSLNKFLGYPVSHATGLIDISIPVYELQAGPLSFPLQLKYHSSGVKIQDPVGVVGRNWSLLPGCRITRTIMGKTDEHYPVVSEREMQTFSDADYMLLASPVYGEPCNNSYGLTTDRAMDGQHDIFTLHLPHISSSFILEESNGTLRVKMGTEKPLLFEPLYRRTTLTTQRKLYGFRVTDQYGVKYTFGEESDSVTNGFFAEPAMAPHSMAFASWLLREAELPGGETIRFTYKKHSERVRNVFESHVVVDREHEIGGSGCPFWWGKVLDNGYLYNFGSSAFVSDLSSSLVPLTIETATHKVSFNYASTGLISSVVVTDNGSEVHRTTLTQNSANRLLTKVTQTGQGSYTLKYKDQDNTTLPLRGFDWWGFSNGVNTTGNIPYHKITAIGGLYSRDIWIGTSGVVREPVAAYMDFRSLQEIVYPTGGSFKITYEPHALPHGATTKIGAGIRVKSTESYDPVSGKTIRKTYTYEGIRYLEGRYPDISSLMGTMQLCNLNMERPSMMLQRTVSTFPSRYAMDPGNLAVWYRKVTETTTGGKVVYEYDFRSDDYQNQSDLGGMNYTVSTVNRTVESGPRLLNKKTYNQSNTLVEELINTYQSNLSGLQGRGTTPGMRKLDGGPLCDFMALSGCDTYRWIDFTGSPVRFTSYQVILGTIQLSATEKRSYTGSNYVSEKTTYTYDAARPYNVTEQSTALSDGTEQVEKFYYANNTLPGRSSLTSAQQTAIAQMDAAGYKSTVIEKEILKGTVRLQSVLTGYKRLSATLYVPETVYYRTRSNGYEARIQFSDHDKYGNPRYVVKDGTERTVCIWGYKGRYPVCVAKNITYAAFTGKVSATVLNAIADATTLSTSHANSLAAVRTSVNTAHVTSFEYKPSVGMIKTTDPRGIITTYTYDTGGRLTSVKNDGGRQDFIYNYVNN